MTSTREGRVTSRQTGADDVGLTTCSRSIQVEEFEVAMPGGVWVAIGGMMLTWLHKIPCLLNGVLLAQRLTLMRVLTP